MATSRVNRTTFAILGYLTCWGPMSGYDVKKALDGSASNFWAESYGQIYPILRRLAEDGLTRAVQGTEAVRGRRVFEVTDAGRKALDEWLLEPTDLGTVRNEFLLKLFFGKRMSGEALRGQLENHRALQESFLSHYEGMRRRLESSFPESEDMPFWRITLRYGERERRAQIDWVNETLEELARLESESGVRSKKNSSRTKKGRSPMSAGGTGRRRKGENQ
ncbi:MAG: PadR family transcriptional regulator [Candidatus Binatia bacterium]|nr:PadR family transcriptional regulator [Candidatus Binatia bacterium]